MFKKILSLAVVFAFFTISCGVCDLCAKMVFFGPPADEQPSIIYYGWRGMGIGMLCGLSAGYLRYEDNNEDSAKNVGISALYGALFGTAGGLLIGFNDLASGQTGIGAIILRDMGIGGSLGLIVGTIWGGIDALKKEDSRCVGRGASWGYLGGVVLGLGIGLIEGPQIVGAKKEKNLLYEFAYIEDSKDNLCPGLRLSYSF